MNRRNWLKLFGISTAALAFGNFTAAAQSGTGAQVKPKPIGKGSTLGLIAPGTAVSDPDDMQKAYEIADFFGFKIKIAESVLNGSGYKTRPAEMRANDVNSMFGDSSIDAVVCLRGGYGSGQILDMLDYKIIADNPKVFLGYSDITALHLAIGKLSGMVTFHGPMMLSSFTNFTIDNFKKIFLDRNFPTALLNPVSISGARNQYPVRAIIPGKATGKTVGGNLSLVCSLMGTKYEIDAKNKILLLEDVEEAPYRIDRMLNQLSLAGTLKDASGIIIGRCADCKPDGSQSSTWDSTLGEVVDYYIKPLDKPAFYGLNFGHTSDQLTIPLGVESEMDAETATLTIKENPFTP